MRFWPQGWTKVWRSQARWERAVRPGRRKAGLHLEALEDRTLPAVVTLTAAGAAAEAGPTAALFTVHRNDDLSAPLTVYYARSGSAGYSAYYPADYTGLPSYDECCGLGYVTLPAGADSALITITPLDDDAVEGLETVQLSLVTGCGTDYTVGSPASATITIADDDVPTVVSISAAGAAAEVGQVAGVFTVSRTGNTNSPLTVYYVRGGSAGYSAYYPADYTGLPSYDEYCNQGSVTIPAGASSALITITPVDDALVEGAETVQLTLTTGCGTDYTLGSPLAATVTIADDDAGQHPPTVVSAARSGWEDEPLILAAADFLSWFSDPDPGDTLHAIRITALPLHGTLSCGGQPVFPGQPLPLPLPGPLTYQPDADYHGIDGFTWTGSDGSADAAMPATLSLTILPTNDAPAFTAGGAVTVAEDAGPQAVAGWATDITAGPPDEAGQTLTSEWVAIDRPELFAVAPALDPATGTLTFTPAADACGSATVWLCLRDDGGTAGGGVDASAARAVTITLLPVDDPPALDAPADCTVAEDAGSRTVVLTGIGDHGDGQPLVVTAWTDDPALLTGLAVTYDALAGGGTVTFTPAAGRSGAAVVTVVVSDAGADGLWGSGDDGTCLHSFTVTVLPVNDRPVAEPQTATIDEDGSVVLTLVGADGDDAVVQGLTWTVLTGPAHGTLSDFDPATGHVRYTPAADTVGADSFTVAVTDDDTAGGPALSSVPATVTLLVLPVNDAPVATGGNVTVVRDSAIRIAPGDDGDPEAVQALTFTLDGEAPAHGSLSGFDPLTGQITYTPDPGYEGPDQFSFRLSDDASAGGPARTSAVATVLLTVVRANQAPLAEAREWSLDEDTALALTLTGDDGEPDRAQTLTFRLIEPPRHGGLSGFDPATGTVVYTPDPDYAGTDQFTFTVTDDATVGGPALTGAPATGRLIVCPVNDRPTATAATHSVRQDSAGPVWLGGDGDPEVEQALFLVLLAAPAHGSLSGFDPLSGALDLPGDGTVVYTPEPGYSGPDSFRYLLSDDASAGGPAGLSGPAVTLSLDVRRVNRPPLALPQTVSTAEGQAAALTLTGDDGDPERTQTLTFVVVALPAHGSLSGFDPATGAVVYTPDPGFAGTDRFDFVVLDDATAGDPGLLRSAVARVSVSVTAVDAAPVAFSRTVATAEDTPLTVVAGDDGDAEAVQPLSYTWLSGPTLGSLEVDPVSGAVIYRPAPDVSGTDTVVFTVSDGTAVSSPATLTVLISPVDDAPEAAEQTVDTAAGTAVSLTLSGDDGDVELAQPLTFAVLTAPAHGVLSGFDPATGQVLYTPLPGWSGEDSFRFTVGDGQAVSPPARVALTVAAAARPPVAGAGTVYRTDDAGTVVLDGSLSYDPDQPADTLSYAWDLDEDGVFGESGAEAARGDETGSAPVFAAVGLDGPTTRVVTLRVSDAGGLSGTATAVIDVANAAPRPVPGAPAVLAGPGAFLRTGSFTDSGGGAYTARVDYGDGGGLQTLPLAADRTFLLQHDYAREGVYTVTVLVLDPDGAVGRGSVEVTVGDPRPALVLRTASGAAVSGTRDLGDWPLRTAQELTLWVHNDGSRPLLLDPASLVLPAGLRLAAPLPERIEPGGHELLALELTVAVAGTYSSTLTVDTNDPAARPLVLTLTARATAPTGSPRTEAVGLLRDTGSGSDRVTCNPTLTGLLTGDLAGGTAVLEFAHATDPAPVRDSLTFTDSPGRWTYDPRTTEPALADHVGPLTVSYRVRHLDADGLLLSAGEWTPFALTLVAAPASAASVAELALANDSGPSGGDRLTADPTLIGRVENGGPGTLVQMEVDGTIAGTAAILADGTFHYFPTGVPYGSPINVRARVREWSSDAGRFIDGAWSPPLTFTLQMDRPPAIAELRLAVAGDGPTSDPTVTGRVAGTDAAGVHVYLYPAQGEVPLASAWTDADGSFTVRPVGPGESGTRTVWARSAAVDPTGQEVFGEWASLTFSWQAPAVPAVGLLQVVEDAGLPALVGRLAGPGPVAFVDVQFDQDGDAATVEGYARSDAAGDFTYLPAGLPVGPVTVRARGWLWSDDRETYLAGDWQAVTFTVPPPAVTTVAVVGLALVEDTGTAGDGVTQRPAFRGRVEGSGSVAGQRVEADLDGDGAADWTALTAADGTFTVTPAGLEAGPVSVRLRARQWDYAGRCFVWSDWAALAFTLEARDPAPAVVDLALQSDTGSSAVDRVTANPLVVGRLAGDAAGGGVLVEVDEDQDGRPDGTAVTDADGRFRYRPEALGYGSVSVRARAVVWDPLAGDLAAGAWATLAFTYQSAPAGPAVIAGLGLARDTGADAGDGVTADPTVVGRVSSPVDPERLTVELHFPGGGADLSVPVDGYGAFTVRPSGLTPGPVEVAARPRYSDPLTGQEWIGGWGMLTFSYQPAANAVPVLAELALASDDGTAADDRVSSDPTVTGRVSDDVSAIGLEVEFDLDGDGAADGTAWTDDSGQFRYSPPGLAAGPVTVRARVKEPLVDGAPQLSPWATLDFTLTGATTGQAEVSELALAGGGSGWQATAAPVLTGRVSGPGGVGGLTVEFDSDGDGAADGRAVTAADGTFSYSPQGLADGPVTVRARAVTATAAGPRPGGWRTAQLVFYSGTLSAAEAGELAAALSGHDAGWATASAAFEAALGQAARVQNQAGQAAAQAEEGQLAAVGAAYQATLATALAGYQAGLAGATATLQAALAGAATGLAADLAAYGGDAHSGPATDFAWPAASAGTPLALPDPGQLPFPDLGEVQGGGGTFRLEADPGYAEASRAAVNRYRQAIRQAEAAVQAARAAAGGQLLLARGLAYAARAVALGLARADYQSTLAQPPQGPVDLPAAARDHQETVRQADETCTARLQRHAADAAANSAAAWTAYQQATQPPLRLPGGEIDYPNQYRREALAYAEYQAVVSAAWRERVERDTRSLTQRVADRAEAWRLWQERQAEADGFLRQWKVTREQRYAEAVAAADRTLAEELAAAQQAREMSVAAALKEYTIRLAGAQAELLQARLEAAVVAVTARVEATDDPESTYLRERIEGERDYAREVVPDYLAYVGQSAEALRQQRADQAAAAATRSRTLAEAARERAVARAAAEAAFQQDTREQRLARLQGETRAAVVAQQGEAEAQGQLDRGMAVAEEYCQVTTATHNTAYTLEVLEIEPGPEHQAEWDAADQRRQTADAAVQRQRQELEIAALAVRGRTLSAAARQAADVHIAAEASWLSDQAGSAATREIGLAGADAAYTRSAARAYGSELTARATAAATRADSVAGAWQTFAEGAAEQAYLAGQDAGDDWEQWQTATAERTYQVVSRWQTSLPATPGSTPAAWASYLLAAAETARTEVGREADAVDDYGDTVGAALRQAERDTAAAAANAERAVAAALAGPGGAVARLVEARLASSDRLAEGQLAQARAVAESTRDHDRQLAAANAAYAEQQAALAEARQNAWDDAEWAYRRPGVPLGTLSLAEAEALLAARETTRRLARADAEEAYAVGLADARSTRAEAAAGATFAYVQGLAAGRLARAAAVRDAALDQADRLHDADVVLAGRLAEAETVQAEATAGADHALDVAGVAAARTLAVAEDAAASAEAAATSTATATFLQGLVGRISDALGLRAASQSASAPAAYQAALARAERDWQAAEATVNAGYRVATATVSATATSGQATAVQTAEVALAGQERSYATALAAALAANGVARETALSGADAGQTKAAAVRTYAETAAGVAHDVAVAAARRDQARRTAQAEVTRARAVAAARAAAYAAGDTAAALQVYQSARAASDTARALADAASASQYARDVGTAAIVRAAAVGAAGISYVLAVNTAASTAVGRTNTAEVTLTTALAAAGSTWTAGVATAAGGLLEGLATAAATALSALGGALSGAVAGLGTVAVGQASAAARVETVYQGGRVETTRARLEQRDGAEAESTRQAAVRAAWVSELAGPRVAAAEASARAEALQTLGRTEAEQAATQRQAAAERASAAVEAEAWAAYQLGTMADEAAAAVAAVGRDNGYFSAVVAAENARALAEAEAHRDYLVARATAARDAAAGRQGAEETLWYCRARLGPAAEDTRPGDRALVEAVLTQGQTAADINFAAAQTLADTAYAAALATATGTYLAGEAAAERGLRLAVAGHDRSYALALLPGQALAAVDELAATLAREASEQRLGYEYGLAQVDTEVSWTTADYQARALALAPAAGESGTPWAQFQQAQAQTLADWWQAQAGPRQVEAFASQAVGATYQAQALGLALGRSATSGLVEAQYQTRAATLAYEQEASLAAADDERVQALVAVAAQTQLAATRVSGMRRVQQLQADTGLAAAVGAAETTSGSGAYGLAAGAATAVWRTAQAAADAGYESGLAQAELAWATATAEADYQYATSEAAADAVRQAALAQVRWDGEVGRAATRAAALATLATSDGSPWASHAAAEAAARSAYTTTVAGVETTYQTAVATATTTLATQQAAATRQRAVAAATAGATAATTRGQANLDRATAENAADAALLASGQSRVELPDWGLASSTWAAPTLPTPADTTAPAGSDSAVSAALAGMFMDMAAQMWQYPGNGYFLDLTYHGAYDPGMDGTYVVPVDRLREGLIRPATPEVTLDQVKTVAPVSAAEAARTVAPAAASCDEATIESHTGTYTVFAGAPETGAASPTGPVQIPTVGPNDTPTPEDINNPDLQALRGQNILLLALSLRVLQEVEAGKAPVPRGILGPYPIPKGIFVRPDDWYYVPLGKVPESENLRLGASITLGPWEETPETRQNMLRIFTGPFERGRSPVESLSELMRGRAWRRPEYHRPVQRLELIEVGTSTTLPPSSTRYRTPYRAYDHQVKRSLNAWEGEVEQAVCAEVLALPHMRTGNAILDLYSRTQRGYQPHAGDYFDIFTLFTLDAITVGPVLVQAADGLLASSALIRGGMRFPELTPTIVRFLEDDAGSVRLPLRQGAAPTTLIRDRNQFGRLFSRNHPELFPEDELARQAWIAHQDKLRAAAAAQPATTFTKTTTPWQRQVYQRGDIDWSLVRPQGVELAGETNWQAARQGYAPGRINPLTGRWDDLVLHHSLDDPRGVVIETWRSSHTRFHNTIGRGPNDFNEFLGQSRPWRELKPAWAEAWKREQAAYWRWRTGQYNPQPQRHLRLPGDP